MKFNAKLFLLFFVSFGFLLGNTIDNLKIYTEEYPPYNYFNQNKNKVEGIYVEIVEYILKDNNSKLSGKDIQLVPWARAYRSALTEKNTAIFALTWTEERDSLFKWVGPVTNTSQVLIAKKNRGIKITKVEDINKYNIGVVRDDVAEQILINSGIDSKKIQQAHSPVLCARMLEAGRIDLWAYGEGPARFIMRTDFGGFDNYEVVHILREGEMYIGFHKDTSDEIVNMFRKSLEKLKTVDIDKYNAILKKYL